MQYQWTLSDIPSPHEAFIEAQKSSPPRYSYSLDTPNCLLGSDEKLVGILINSPNNNNTFHAFSKIYLRLVKESQSGKKFDLPDKNASNQLQPLDLKLLESLRKKHGL